MARRVVCISRILGAGGPEVAQLVADALGYVLVDEEIVQQAAASQGISVDELADVERRTTFMDRFLQNLAAGGGGDGYMLGIAALPPPSTGPSDRKSLRALIRTSIEETADRGDVVIVSHAASYALAGREDVLRVLVTASRETRLARAAADGSLDAKRAAKVVTEDDAGRAAYLKQFYGVEHELPTHYELTLNSDSLSTTAMADLVVRAASAG
jgi:cytidylate kinase